METQQRRVARARVATRAAATAPSASAATECEPRAQVASAEASEGAGDEVALPADAVTRVGYAPVVRVDAARREVELCATSEAIDSYGTVFDYAASKDAFMRWIGNVREMHERRAVGQRVQVRCDDAARRGASWCGCAFRAARRIRGRSCWMAHCAAPASARAA